MEPPVNCTQLRSFMGRVSYVSRIFLALIELLEPFHDLLKKNAPLEEARSSRKLFQKVKDVLNSPLTKISRLKGLTLRLYLICTNNSILTLHEDLPCKEIYSIGKDGVLLEPCL